MGNSANRMMDFENISPQCDVKNCHDPQDGEWVEGFFVTLAGSIPARIRPCSVHLAMLVAGSETSA